MLIRGVSQTQVQQLGLHFAGDDDANVYSCSVVQAARLEALGYAVVKQWWRCWRNSGATWKLIQVGSLVCCCLEYKMGIGCSVVALTMKPRPVETLLQNSCRKGTGP